MSTNICSCQPRLKRCPAVKSITFNLSYLRFLQRESVRRRARSFAPDNLKDLLIKSFLGTCQYCGCDALDATIDRIKPQRSGGDYSASNVTLACRSCNSRKGASDVIGPVRSFADVGGSYV